MFRELRLDATTDPMQRLGRLIESILPLDDRRVAMTRIFLVFYAEAGANVEAREEVIDYLHNWRRVVARIVIEAQAAGQIPSELDPMHLSTELVGLADGIAMHAMLDPEILGQFTGPEGVVIDLVSNAWTMSGR